MDITLGDIITWVIVGGFAGSVVGAIAARKKAGYGRIKNFIIGLIGAVIGGVLFKMFPVELPLPEVTITLKDIVSAMIGAFLLLIVIWIIGRKRGG